MLKNKKTLVVSLQVSLLICIFAWLILMVSLFLISDSASLNYFYSQLFDQHSLFWKPSYIFYCYIVLVCISIFVWILWMLYFFASQYYSAMQMYNKKLSSYNHYLAHEVKTPLSIIHSNLDVLKHGFNKDKVDQSQAELLSITKIIDSLLYISESLKVSETQLLHIETVLKQYIASLDKTLSQSIFIQNHWFDVSIDTDKQLLLRIVKNLIENAYKYSSDKQLVIDIYDDSIVFRNNIDKTLSWDDLSKIMKKFHSKNWESQWLWLSIISDIIEVLWFQFFVTSQNKEFIISIHF